MAVGATGLRDPFAWREALTPPNGASPACSARSSHAGSYRSGASNNLTPTSNTPPSSPHNLNLSARSQLSVGSNTSSRSGGGRAYAQHLPMGSLPQANADQSRSWSSGSGTGRSSAYITPNSSARISEFGSVYDSQSHCGSARTADLCSVYENGPTSSPDPAFFPDTPETNKVPSRKKQRAYAAAFDSFAPPVRKDKERGSSSPSGARQAEPVEVSTDPRSVFSSARHGRHKEVEASLAAGFEPSYADSFGNTLFHVACQNGIKRVAKLAIKYGGDMDQQNLKGNTGVHFLYAYGYQEIGEYFIEKGASDQLLNDVGKNAREGIR